MDLAGIGTIVGSIASLLLATSALMKSFGERRRSDQKHAATNRRVATLQDDVERCESEKATLQRQVKTLQRRVKKLEIV